MDIQKKENVFQRSGLAAFSDLDHSEYKDIISFLEKEQNIFLCKESEFRSINYKWPCDPLHSFSRIWEYPYVYYHLSEYISSLPKGSKPIVADIGSGVTFFPFSIAKLGYQVVCTDTDPICERDLYRAFRNVSYAPGTMDFRLAESSRIPFKDSECDALYCISVLEHIPEFEITVEEIVRILKPNGLCLLTCDINLFSEDKFQFGNIQYEQMMSLIDEYFVRLYPEKTIHPINILTTLNSPYPINRQHINIFRKSYNFAKHKLIKSILGLIPGVVKIPRPYLTVIGFVLRKKSL